MAMTAVEKAKETLRKAEAREFDKLVKKQEREKAAQKKATEAATKEYVKKENSALARMKGLTLHSVQLFPEGEGTVYFAFTDGTEFYLTASGGDATYIGYGFSKGEVVR